MKDKLHLTNNLPHVESGLAMATRHKHILLVPSAALASLSLICESTQSAPLLVYAGEISLGQSLSDLSRRRVNMEGSGLFVQSQDLAGCLLPIPSEETRLSALNHENTRLMNHAL